MEESENLYKLYGCKAYVMEFPYPQHGLKISFRIPPYSRYLKLLVHGGISKSRSLWWFGMIDTSSSPNGSAPFRAFSTYHPQIFHFFRSLTLRPGKKWRRISPAAPFWGIRVGLFSAAFAVKLPGSNQAQNPAGFPFIPLAANSLAIFLDKKREKLPLNTHDTHESGLICFQKNVCSEISTNCAFSLDIYLIDMSAFWGLNQRFKGFCWNAILKCSIIGSCSVEILPWRLT